MVEPRGQERIKGPLPSHVLLTVPFNPLEQESSCPFTNGSHSTIKASSRTFNGLHLSEQLKDKCSFRQMSGGYTHLMHGREFFSPPELSSGLIKIR